MSVNSFLLLGREGWTSTLDGWSQAFAGPMQRAYSGQHLTLALPVGLSFNFLISCGSEQHRRGSEQPCVGSHRPKSASFVPKTSSWGEVVERRSRVWLYGSAPSPVLAPDKKIRQAVYWGKGGNNLSYISKDWRVPSSYLLRGQEEMNRYFGVKSLPWAMACRWPMLCISHSSALQHLGGSH